LRRRNCLFARERAELALRVCHRCFELEEIAVAFDAGERIFHAVAVDGLEPTIDDRGGQRAARARVAGT
jgi:hypothetical protein